MPLVIFLNWQKLITVMQGNFTSIISVPRQNFITFYRTLLTLNSLRKRRKHFKHCGKMDKILVASFVYFLYPPQDKCFQGYTGINLSVRLCGCVSVCPSLCRSVHKILYSVKVLAGGGCMIKSPSVTALVLVSEHFRGYTGISLTTCPSICVSVYPSV